MLKRSVVRKLWVFDFAKRLGVNYINNKFMETGCQNLAYWIVREMQFECVNIALRQKKLTWAGYADSFCFMINVTPRYSV